MGKNIFLFSGQGSQYEGMGIELANRYPTTKKIYECASDITGLDIRKICETASIGELSQTNISQPAILTTSLVALEALKQEGIEFSAVAGHSLGEYAAMVASEIVSIEDGYTLIKHRASAMQKCAEENPGSMCAVMGLEAEEIEKVCKSIDGYVVAVNYNSPAQTVIAGEIEAVDKATSVFSEMGKKCIKLAVNAAFHSKLMQDAADEFVKNIKDVKFNTPIVDFYSNITGEILTDFSDMPSYLATHLVSPVRFVKELNTISNAGYDNFVELGPNKVLTGLVKKTLKGSSAMNVENEKTLLKALDILK